MGVYKKIFKIQEAVNGLSKDSQAFGYDYVSGSKILSIIKPIMNKEKLILKQEIIEIENLRQDYEAKKGNKSEILSKVMMRFTWVCVETGETDINLFGANGQNGFDKGVGSALTYAERYFLLKYFHIATDEDDIDRPKPKISNERFKNALRLLKNKETTSEDITSNFELTPEQLTDLNKLKTK